MKTTFNHRRSLLLAATGGLLLSACDQQKKSYDFASIDITGAEYARGFSLKDGTGQVRSLAQFKDKIVVVFFGFVQCPDVCPTTMAELAEVKKLLGKNGDKLQVVFITVDPERDTPTVLGAYLAAFDPKAVGLIPAVGPELDSVVKEFKVFFKKVPGPTPTSYTVEHTTHGYVFDTQGKIRLVSRYGMGAKALAADIEQLL
jgi:protein SCO1/2